MKLSDANENDRLQITEIVMSPEHRKLSALGIITGCKLLLLLKNAGGVLIEAYGCKYALDINIAECILVKRILPQ